MKFGKEELASVAGELEPVPRKTGRTVFASGMSAQYLEMTRWQWWRTPKASKRGKPRKQESRMGWRRVKMTCYLSFHTNMREIFQKARRCSRRPGKEI